MEVEAGNAYLGHGQGEVNQVQGGTSSVTSSSQATDAQGVCLIDTELRQ